MALRANYVIIAFDEHLGDNENDLPLERFKRSSRGFIYDDYAFVGNQSTVRTFTIDSLPRGGGYLTIQLLDVHDKGHRLEINGTELGKECIMRTDPFSGHTLEWKSWTTDFKTRILRAGENTVQIFKGDGSTDNFVVGTIVINWREET